MTDSGGREAGVSARGLGASAGGAIHGIGVDLVDIDRFHAQLDRTPALITRLFTEEERTLPIHSLAARFAAKEALIKALGGSESVSWQDMSVPRLPKERPEFHETPGLCAVLRERGLRHPHLSLSHDGGFAIAYVVVERAEASA